MITMDKLIHLRKRIRDLGPGKTNAAISKILSPEFSEFRLNTITDHVNMLSGASDYRFGLMVNGSISIGMLAELCQSKLDGASKDTLAQIVVDRKMLVADVRRVKKILRKGKGRISLATAVDQATGKIPLHSKFEEVMESTKSLGKCVDDLNDASIMFMTKLQMAIDVIPGSILDTGDSYLSVYEKIVTLENTLDTSLKFITERKKRLFEAIRSHVVTEATMNQKRLEGRD